MTEIEMIPLEIFAIRNEFLPLNGPELIVLSSQKDRDTHIKFQTFDLNERNFQN